MKSLLKPIDCRTVQDMGWASKVNGELIGLAIKAEFTVFLTVDKNLQYQNPLKKYEISLVVLDTPRNKYEFIEPLKDKILVALRNAEVEKIQIIS
jgi:hypothetical protein